MATEHYIKDYPRPQFVRKEWQNLNGDWSFRFDDGNVGERERWNEQLHGDLKIQVPFTYETEASGIGETTFHPYVWYERELQLPADLNGKRVMLNFQAVDYTAKVWVNGSYAGGHQGGYAAFSLDITDYVNTDTAASNRLVVKVEDSQSCTQPRASSAGWMRISSASMCRQRESGKVCG